jgi:hypothetical protein
MGLGGLPRKGLLPKIGQLKGTTVERGGLEHPGVTGRRDPDACRKWAGICQHSS